MEILKYVAAAGDRSRLPFLVIGGLAVNAHGYSRLTADVDILVRRSDAEAWIAVLAELGYATVNRGETFIQLDPPMPGLWPVDLLLVSQRTFEQLEAEAIETDLHGTRVRIPSVEHLCALKLHALRQALPHRDAKDFIDLLHLVRFNRIDPRSATFRILVEKHGTPALHERLLQALALDEDSSHRSG